MLTFTTVQCPRSTVPVLTYLTNRPISADMNRLASVAELAQLDRSNSNSGGGGPPKSWKPGKREGVFPEVMTMP